MNIVKRILKADRGRDPERLAMKYLSRRSGPFPFLLGTCHLLYDRLASSGWAAYAAVCDAGQFQRPAGE